ncbi:MAG: hypothetical protein GWN73_19875, partial [Actinobacteria bacterium]|nr:hypothetical protein [Actinomycetota bacterium]NIU67557.1 hypothetical protein [Actinomycetota bacterium]
MAAGASAAFAAALLAGVAVVPTEVEAQETASQTEQTFSDLSYRNVG